MIRNLLQVKQKGIIKSIGASNSKLTYSLLSGNKFNINALKSNAFNGIRFASTQANLGEKIELVDTKKVAEITPIKEEKIESQPIANNVETTNIDSSTFTEPTLVQNIEPTSVTQVGDFANLGLCNYTPVGALEKILELLTLGAGLPWITTIAVTTVTIRFIMLPIIINLNKSATRIANVKPEMDAITAKINRAKADQDHYELALQSQNLRKLFKEHDLKPFRMMLMPVVQAPVMISFFLALRALAEVPIPSMLNGGALWFTNLAVADPYYALPVISSLGFLAVFEMGSELGAASQQQPPWMKNFMRGLSLAMIPFTATLPAAVFMYWIPSNIFSLFQIYTLNQPKVRKMLKMPELVKHLKKPVPKGKKAKGFFK